MNKYYFSIGALTDIGNVRSTNQDSILVKIGEEDSGEFGLFVIADGMGGLAAGGIASDIAVSEIKKWWEERLEDILTQGEFNFIDIIDNELSELVHKIHDRVADYGRTIREKVGTTLSLLFIFRDDYLVKHIGDSRIYIIRKDIRQITVDHSWVAQQIRERRLPEEAARTHPGRNLLIQCIGASDKIIVFEDKGRIEPEDTFLLCSDGFFNHVEDDEMYTSLKNFKKSLSSDKAAPDVQHIVAGLFEKVKQRGATDNVSVIIVHLNKQTQKKPIASFLKDIIKKNNL